MCVLVCVCVRALLYIIIYIYMYIYTHACIPHKNSIPQDLVGILFPYKAK